MRRRKAKKHAILPDSKYNEVVVTKFVNNLMMHGKKSVAYKIFYDALDIIQEKVGEEESSLDVWKKALHNVTPGVEVKSRRVGGATYQIPTPVRDARKQSLAMTWMISYARKRNEKSMAQRLAFEIIAGSKEEGAAYKKKEDVHRMAEANKAFSHFRV
ncbi:MAG: 30S ribosomal protein S7 [Crocinitomicaceae bacterium]